MATTCKLNAHKGIGDCSDDCNSRYNLGNLQIKPATDKTVWATATDGRVVSIAEVEGRADETTLMPSDILPTAKYGGRVSHNGEWMSVSRKKVRTAPTVDHDLYPDVAKCLPNNADDYVAIKLDTDMLSRLGNALSNRGDDEPPTLTLFVPTKSPNEVTLAVGDRGIGAIMPHCVDSIDDVRKKYADTLDRYKD